jgi:hypothetical protein
VSRREAWITAAGIFVVALVVRTVVAAAIPFPAQDAAYYVGVARNLAEGHGLVSNAGWSYLTPPLELPRPAFEVWLPLPSLLAAVSIALSGATAPIPIETAMRAAQVTTVPLGALLAVLTWRLAADVAIERGLSPERARTLAIGSGLTAAVYLPLVLHGVEPDSTTMFGVLAVAACLLMTRVLRDPRGARLTDGRLLATGVLLGAAALTRNEAVWLALAWAWLAVRRAGLPGVEKLRLVGIVAVVSLLVYAPWAARDWAVFGTPLPGQAAANALSVNPTDIFAWNDPPTLARYLAVGPVRLAEMRVEGVVHNVLNVLLLLGIPVSVIGLLSLPWQGRDRALRPVLLLCVLTFLATSLAFPVATTWGTYLHAAAPAHVLLIVSALGGLDAVFAALGRRMGWTRPIAWLGALLAVAGSALFSLVLLPNTAREARDTARTYEVLARQMEAIGSPLGTDGPVITDQPVWLAEAARIPALALPDEPPADVLALARDPRFDARWLVITKEEHGRWPAVLENGADPAAACFREVTLPVPDDPADASAIDGVRVFRIECRSKAGVSRVGICARCLPEGSQ